MNASRPETRDCGGSFFWEGERGSGGRFVAPVSSPFSATEQKKDTPINFLFFPIDA